MRRLLIEEPVSRAASWSRRIGSFAWLCLAIVLLLAWLGRLKPFETLTAVAACGALAVLAVMLAIIALRHTWRSGARGVPNAITGAMLGIALLAYPVGICLRDVLDPRPLDLTTDLATPPEPLEPLPQLPAGSPAPTAATTQDAGAPRPIAALLLDQTMDESLTIALRAAGVGGWHVSKVEYSRPPARDEARFAATVPSLFIRWPSDAIVRLVQTEDGVSVDVRLIAREPWSLLRGGNRDISGYLDRLETLASGKYPHAGR
jgi:hypothetical protein